MTTNGYTNASIPDLMIQWASARQLHVKETEVGVPFECYNADCDHDDECPTSPFDVCRECYGNAVEMDEGAPLADWYSWPCATARALGAVES